MSLIKHISIYTFVSFFGAGINFFLMPYLSHFIEPNEYGILSILNSYITILIPLIGLVASGLITVEYYKLKDKKEFASLFTSIQVIPLVLSIFFLLVTILFLKTIARFLEIPDDKSYWLIICIFLGVFTIYFETLTAYNIIEKKPIQYAVFIGIKIFIEVGLTLWFVSGLGMGWEGRMWAWCISTAVLSIISLLYFRHQSIFPGRVVRKYVMAGVYFGLPLILHTIGKFVINQSNRIFIAKMVSIDEAGIYNIGAQVGIVIILLAGAIGNFYQPFLYERLADPTLRAQAQIAKFNYAVILGLLVCLILLTLFTPLFFDLFISKKYARATVYVFWVGLGYFFWGIYLLYTGVIFYYKKTNFLGAIALMNILISIVLNYILIKYFGALGAAYASCISYLFVASIVTWKANAIAKKHSINIMRLNLSDVWRRN